MSKMKNKLDRINRRLNSTEGSTNEPENIVVETTENDTHTHTQKIKTFPAAKIEMSISELWENL